MFLSVALLSPPYSTLLTYSLPPGCPPICGGPACAWPCPWAAARYGRAWRWPRWNPGAADLPAGTKVRPSGLAVGGRAAAERRISGHRARPGRPPVVHARAHPGGRSCRAVCGSRSASGCGSSGPGANPGFMPCAIWRAWTPPRGKSWVGLSLPEKPKVLALAEDAAAGEVCELARDPPWSVRPNALRQRAVLDYLLEHGAVSRRRLGDALPESGPALSALLKAGLVRVRPPDSGEDGREIEEAEEALLPPPSPPFDSVRRTARGPGRPVRGPGFGGWPERPPAPTCCSA